MLIIVLFLFGEKKLVPFRVSEEMNIRKRRRKMRRRRRWRRRRKHLLPLRKGCEP